MPKFLKSAAILTGTVLSALFGTSLDASAHEFGHLSNSGVWTGFFHSLGGFDHILALLAVGVWASQHRGRIERWMPVVFVVVMILGAFVASAGQAFPAADFGIAASVTILGIMLATAITLQLPIAFFLVSVFAIFHGFSHGAQLAETANAAPIGAGLIAATILLQFMGIGLGRIIRHQHVPNLARGLGVGFAVAGAALFAI